MDDYSSSSSSSNDDDDDCDDDDDDNNNNNGRDGCWSVVFIKNNIGLPQPLHLSQWKDYVKIWTPDRQATS